jgi:hypothetical protein
MPAYLGSVNNGMTSLNARNTINNAINRLNATGQVKRIAVQLTGHSTPEVPADPGQEYIAPSDATAPPPVTIQLYLITDGYVTINTNLASYTFTFAGNDPNDGTVWVNNGSNNTEDLHTNFISALNGQSSALGISANYASGLLYDIIRTDSGSASTLSASSDVFGTSGGGNGTDYYGGQDYVAPTDAVPPSGGTIIVPIYGSGYPIMILSAHSLRVGGSSGPSVCIKQGSDENPIKYIGSTASGVVELLRTEVNFGSSFIDSSNFVSFSTDPGYNPDLVVNVEVTYLDT